MNNYKIEKNKKIDLHTHSTFSDGTFTPIELVHAAKAAGLSAFALTDHDTIDGVSVAREEAKKVGVELIGGCEISVDYKGTQLHLLAYFVENGEDELRKYLLSFEATRQKRNVEMANKLASCGVIITDEDLLAGEKTVVTRAHYARAMVRKGYVRDNNEAFDKYLGIGKKCYTKRVNVDVIECITFLRRYNIVPVLAHPFLYGLDAEEIRVMVEELASAGLLGIEGIYRSHTDLQNSFINKWARENDLAVTGGSDFHGENKPGVFLGVGRNNISVDFKILEALKGLVQ